MVGEPQQLGYHSETGLKQTEIESLLLPCMPTGIRVVSSTVSSCVFVHLFMGLCHPAFTEMNSTTYSVYPSENGASTASPTLLLTMASFLFGELHWSTVWGMGGKGEAGRVGEQPNNSTERIRPRSSEQ